jgi:hypothetical protein
VDKEPTPGLLPFLVLAALAGVIAFLLPQSFVVALPAPLRLAILGGAALIGLMLAERVGLGLAPHGSRHPILLALALGIAVGAAYALADGMLFRTLLPAVQIEAIKTVPAWQRMAGFMSLALVDDMVYRLFLVSLLAWIGTLVLRRPAPAIGFGIIASALIYVALHLGGSAAASPTPLLVLHEIGLHFTVAALWGYVFWRFGLLTAMLAHLTAHVPLQLGLSLLIAGSP